MLILDRLSTLTLWFLPSIDIFDNLYRAMEPTGFTEFSSSVLHFAFTSLLTQRHTWPPFTLACQRAENDGKTLSPVLP